MEKRPAIPGVFFGWNFLGWVIGCGGGDGGVLKWVHAYREGAIFGALVRAGALIVGACGIAVVSAVAPAWLLRPHAALLSGWLMVFS
jgi:hypothetical protein